MERVAKRGSGRKETGRAGGSAESQIRFPDPRTAGEDGLLCYGGNLEVATLVEAYSHGIFPWPQEGLPLLWFSPAERGVLDFSELHWSRRFLRTVRKAFVSRESPLKITFNRDFAGVISACAQSPRANQPGTWILPEMQKAYCGFHEAGFAHSVECWQDGDLIGGLYGVYVGGVFSGESMFYKKSDASKLCLFALTDELKKAGLGWMDIQMVTPVSESVGGKYVPREQFLLRLKRAREKHPKSLEFPKEWSGHERAESGDGVEG